MAFWHKSEEEQRQKEFERRCREATLEVINRHPAGKVANEGGSSEAAASDKGRACHMDSSWPYETVHMVTGNHVTRLRSTLFYWGAAASFITGIILLSNELLVGGFLALTLAPCLLLYPLIRFLFGGKDSIAAAVTTVVVEEVLKGEIQKAADKLSRKRRR
jgi:hypothetical protein